MNQEVVIVVAEDDPGHAALIEKNLKRAGINNQMITFADGREVLDCEIARCHEIGCSSYITKPVEYDRFIEAIRQLGLFLLVVEVPELNGP
jgi:CheY-like chemotaxis protein